MLAILAEKPSAARNMAKAFGGSSGTFDGEQFEICASRGHLYEFSNPEDQVPPDKKDKYHSWLLENMPWDSGDLAWGYMQKPDTDDTLDAIRETFKKCDEIVIATDDDPSGEGTLLAAEIIINLGFDKKKVSRMFFADESAKSLQKAFRNRKYFPSVYDDPDYKKSLYRSKWDFMSMQFTRIATKCGDNKSVLRQGRLKSLMVVLSGDQLARVAAYKKIPFYQYRFRDENNNVFIWDGEPRVDSKDKIQAGKYGPSAVIAEDKVRKTTAPPKLIDLASLAARLAPKGFKAQEVLNTYQKMYEAQIVSYPRTEDKAITMEQFNELLPLADKIASVVGVDKNLLTHREPRSGFVKEGMAHGANRPGTNVPNSMSELSQYGKCAEDIYYILATSYLAMLCPDYEYDAQEAHLEKYPDFKGKISIPAFAGWKAVYQDDDADDEEAESPGFGNTAEPFVHEGFPPKPQTPTFKWLKTQLEKLDVGTGATRTSTYAEVTNEKAKYPLLKDSKGKISMTEFGEMSYRLLPDTHIGSAELTKHVFDDMKEIASGKLDPDERLKEVAGFVKDDIEAMIMNGEAMRQELGIKLQGGSGSAEKCTGDWNGKEISFKRAWSGHRFTDEECEKLLAGEYVEIEAVSAKSGKPFKYKGHLEWDTYNGHKYVAFKGDFVKDGNAPGGDAEYFEGTWKKQDVKVKRVWSGHRFTDDEVADLLAGKEITIKAKSAKTGKTFTCKGKLAKQKYNGNDFIGFKADFK